MDIFNISVVFAYVNSLANWSVMQSKTAQINLPSYARKTVALFITVEKALEMSVCRVFHILYDFKKVWK